MQQRRAKYAYLLEDEDVKRWYENTARGSLVSADVCLRRLGSVCEQLEIKPKEFAALPDKELHNLLMDYVSIEEKKGHAGNYINSTMKALKSWLAHNQRETKIKIKINGVDETPTLKDERVPTLAELRKIFLSGGGQARTACVLVAHSGLRIQTLGDYMGKDGLRIKDLPELKIEAQTVTFSKIPALVIVRQNLSKAGHQYFTFLSEEGCGYLKDYLEERLREGETFTSNSPIITPKLKMKPFIRSVNVGDLMRDAMRKVGFSMRPYVLRSFFDTELMLAESKGLILRDYRQFWMGHKGDIEHRYTLNKRKLPDNVITDMRQAYERSQEFLQTTQNKETSEEKLAKALRKQLLLVAGFKQEEIDKIDLSELGDEEIQGILRRKLMGGGTQTADLNKPQPSTPKQRVVSVQETNNFLERGWEYVAKISDNMVIIKNN